MPQPLADPGIVAHTRGSLFDRWWRLFCRFRNVILGSSNLFEKGQQRLYLATEISVVATGFSEILVSVILKPILRLPEDLLYLVPTVRSHAISLFPIFVVLSDAQFRMYQMKGQEMVAHDIIQFIRKIGRSHKILNDGPIVSPHGKIELQRTEFAYELILTGDFTYSELVHDFLECSAEILRNPPQMVMLDLSGIEHANSQLIATLVLIFSQFRMRGIAISVLASHEIRTWLQLCKIELLFQDCMVKEGHRSSPSVES